MRDWKDANELQNDEGFLSVTQAAEKLGITRQSVLYAIKHKWRIRNNSLKIGNTWIIKRDAVEAAYGVNYEGQHYLKS